MATAKAIRIHETGGPEVLRYEDVELPEVGPGEARVRHRAIGVNFIDTYHRSGLYSLPGLPQTLGMEGAGVVEEVGEGVTEVEVGQRVGHVTAGAGAYAEARVLPADKLVPLPDEVSFEQAAAVMLQGMTVEYLVRRTFAVQPGMTVLFHAAAGGVGLIACQWLAHIGARVIGTVSTKEKAELAGAHGCAHPILYTEEDFVERVKELAPEGLPVIYDSVGKDTLHRDLDCLRPRGMLVSFGNASGEPEPIQPLTLGRKGSLYLTRPSLFHYVATREELTRSAAALLELVAEGVIDATPRHRYPLAEAARCHEDLEARRTSGSIILEP